MQDLSAVILAGGRGTRLGGDFGYIPKPLVRIGPFPILLHIVSIYLRAGVRKFVVCSGYKSDLLRDYLKKTSSESTDVDFVFKTGDFPDLLGNVDFSKIPETFLISLLDTGLDTTTSGRLAQAMQVIEDDTFLCTYGDGVARLEINEVLEFHEGNGFDITLTAFHPPSRFGEVSLGENGRVTSFREKQLSSALVNGGFFVINRSVRAFLEAELPLELGLLTSCAQNGSLGAFVSKGFWQTMDTPREVELLNSLYVRGKAPWIYNETH